jgi:hypothetical protein
MKDKASEFSEFFRWRIFDQNSPSGVSEFDEDERILPVTASEEDQAQRYEKLIGQWVFEVVTLEWPHPHEPRPMWHLIDHWAEEPSAKMREQVESAALRDTRYFKRCRTCKQLNNVGHMHNSALCYTCAAEEFHIVY